MVRLAGCCVQVGCEIQASHALGSCEAELYSVGVQGIHALPVEQMFARELSVVFGDGSSALQLASRKGIGRWKHVEVRQLALQSLVAAGTTSLDDRAKG